MATDLEALRRGVKTYLDAKSANRKPKKRAAAKKPRPAAPGEPENKVVQFQPRPRMKVPDDALSSARTRRRTRLNDQPRPNVGNPFTPAEPPPGVLPKGKKGMAQDENIQIITGWGAAGYGYGNGAFVEGVQFMGYPYLSQLAQRPEFRVISETIAEECTRKWIDIRSSSEEPAAADKVKLIVQEFDRLRVRDHMREIVEQDGFFGRAHLYLDTGATDDPDELKLPIGNGINSISKMKVSKRKPLKRLKTVEAIWCYPANYNSNDPLKTDWYNPDAWFVQGKEVHVSRLIPFIGREVPDMLKPAYSFGGLSLSQMVKPYVDNWLNTRQGVADIIQNFSIRGLKTNMGVILQDGGAELFKRLDLFNLLSNNQGVAAIDKTDEEMFQITVPLSSLDALQGQSQEHMASVSRIPLVKLLGIQPAGLNASSEGELITFEDHIHAYQEKMLRHPVTRILHFVQLSLFGEVDPSIGFIFNPLREMTEKEKAEIEKLKAETDDLLVNGVGAVSPEEVRKRIVSDINSGYQGLNPEDVPEPPEDDGEGGISLTGHKGLNDGQPDEPGDGEVGKDSETPFAHDEAPFDESKHPRVTGGKNAGHFGKGGGASGSSASGGEAHTETPTFNSKKDHVAHLLAQGTTAAEILKATGWPSVSVPAMAKAARLNLKKEKVDGKTVYTGTPMKQAEIDAITPPVRKAQKAGRGPAGRSRDSWTLLESLAANGGIKESDPLISDLRASIGKKNIFVPGFGMLIRKDGKPLDRAREAAVEGGYIGDWSRDMPTMISTSTINDLLESMDRELRGDKQYREGYLPSANREKQLEDLGRHLDDELESADIPASSVSGKLRDRILQMMEMEGVRDAFTAYERAVMEETQTGADDGEYERIEDDIPFWDVPDEREPA